MEREGNWTRAKERRCAKTREGQISGKNARGGGDTRATDGQWIRRIPLEVMVLTLEDSRVGMMLEPDTWRRPSVAVLISPSVNTWTARRSVLLVAWCAELGKKHGDVDDGAVARTQLSPCRRRGKSATKARFCRQRKRLFCRPQASTGRHPRRHDLFG